MQNKNYLINNKELIRKWDWNKNSNLNPSKLTIGSNKKAWWICEKGHEWQAAIVRIKGGSGCPYCSGHKVLKGFNDFETYCKNNNMEYLIEEFDKNKNNISINEVTFGSGKKVWWKCPKNHSYVCSIRDKVRGYGCPICSNRKISVGYNDLNTTNPRLAKEWHPTKNGDLTPKDVTANSGKKVWWICEKGHEWCTSVQHRNNGTNCPKCNDEKQTSFPEQALVYYLGKQLDVESRKKIGNYEADIFIQDLNLAIEYDGIIFHSNIKAKKREENKNKIFKSKGIDLIRIKEYNNSYVDNEKNIIYCKYDSNYNYLTFVFKSLQKIFDYKYNMKIKIDVNIERDQNKILSNYKKMNKINSLIKINPNLAKEWNYNKNGTLNPNYFTSKSNYKVWWVCEKGHEWRASINSRNNGRSCPFCSGRFAVPGETDLATTHPNLAKEWNYDKNKNLLPSMFSSGSSKKVWWICEKGHEWQATIANRKNGNNCPYCRGKKILQGYNDLKTWCINNDRYDLINEFDYEKNNFKITDITYGSGKKVWWICKKGHSYQTYLTHRTKMNTSCPYCSNQKILTCYNDLETLFPLISKEWDFQKNTKTPNEIGAKTQKKYWWICENGHKWKMSVYDRTINNRKCPICKENDEH